MNEGLSGVDAALRQHFGHVPVRASVTFLGVEPIEVLRFESMPGEWAYLTLGMSRHPMTPADAPAVAAGGPRAELMLQVSADQRYGDAWKALALLAAAPAVEGVVYRPDLTVDTGQPLANGSSCSGGVIMPSAIETVVTGAGPVEVLQLLPATPAELAWSRARGAAALRASWRDAGVDLLDLGRPAVRLEPPGPR